MTSKLAQAGWLLAGGMALHCLGCECDDAPPLQPSVVTPAPAPEPPRESLVHATRSGLPESIPSITITLDGDHFTLSNAALIATWPAPDRDRVAEARPPAAAATWPTVEREGTLPTTPGYRAPEVEAALTMAREAELARSQSGAPFSYALRVQPETPWSNVVRVLFSSGMAGFNEPRFVLARGGGEVELRLPLPSTAELAAARPPATDLPANLAGRDPQEIANAIRAALEAHPPQGAEASTAPSPIGDAPAHQVTLAITQDGVLVVRDTERLAPGCTHTAIGREPTLATAQLDPESLTACLTQAGPSPRGYTLSADGALPFARVISVAETVSAVGRVAFGVVAQ